VEVLRAVAASLAGEIERAADLVSQSLSSGHKVLLFGNGGSAAEAQHVAAEFVGRFEIDRPALPALALSTDTSALTALGNDFGFDTVFARQVEALATQGDVAIALSTSGTSPNVVEGLRAARASGLGTVALTGAAGGPAAELADVAIRIPSESTARIQEAHLAVCHTICQIVESELHAR
jgi:D-sedoheptulose 7-phosphate isomerase